MFLVLKVFILKALIFLHINFLAVWLCKKWFVFSNKERKIIKKRMRYLTLSSNNDMLINDWRMWDARLDKQYSNLQKKYGNIFSDVLYPSAKENPGDEFGHDY